jgi:hypothetical protein
MDAPVESIIETMELTPTPGTDAVINDPPTDPELGEMDTNFGVKLRDASTIE